MDVNLESDSKFQKLKILISPNPQNEQINETDTMIVENAQKMT